MYTYSYIIYSYVVYVYLHYYYIYIYVYRYLYMWFRHDSGTFEVGPATDTFHKDSSYVPLATPLQLPFVEADINNGNVEMVSK